MPVFSVFIDGERDIIAVDRGFPGGTRMKNELVRAIIALNQVDRRIIQGKLRVQELDRTAAAREKAVEAARELAHQAEAGVRENIQAADRLNMEIRTAEAEVGDQEKKLKSIKSQREFRIVTDRIKDLKIQMDENESQVLVSMEELDRLREKVTEYRNRIGEEELMLMSARQQAKEELAEIKAKHAELLAERKEAVSRVEALDSAAYQAYDMALKRTKGDPLAEMSHDGICQACFRRLNSNVANIVHIGKDIKNCRCQGCGRILYTGETDKDGEEKRA
jgi:predicted  nucleic acid-binding Zn-ribbon protein